MRRSIPKRTYSAEYREAAVRQVIDAGRGQAEVARSLEISPKTLANWVRLTRAQRPLVKRVPAMPPQAAALELSRLRAEMLIVAHMEPKRCRHKGATVSSA